MSEATRWLVVAIGNPLRRDDGLACWVADRLAEEEAPNVTVASVFQLLPETAEAFVDAAVVLFVDAAPADSDTPLSPKSNAWGHRFTIADLAELARSVYGAAPEVREVRIPGVDFGFGDGFSDAGQAAAERALRELQAIMAREAACTKSA